MKKLLVILPVALCVSMITAVDTKSVYPKPINKSESKASDKGCGCGVKPGSKAETDKGCGCGQKPTGK